MKIYLAGIESTNTIMPYFAYQPRHVLISYYGLRKKEFPKITCTKDVFLDSGAYSAWTHKTTLDVHEYAQFVAKNLPYIRQYANLDVKGSVEKTIENQKALEEHGLTPLPVFHVNTKRWDVLEEYISKYEYIALGAIAGEKAGRKPLEQLLNEVFRRVKRNPMTKFHGFGLTQQWCLEEYPFFSVDSTSWLAPIQYGNATMLPGIKSGATFKEKSDKIFKMSMKVASVVDIHAESKPLKATRRLELSVRAYNEYEDFLTALWKKRGIVWNE